MFYVMLLTFLGSIFVIRISAKLDAHKIFSRSELAKIVIGYFSIVLIAVYFFVRTHFQMWCAVFGALVIVVFLLIYLGKKRTQNFRTHIIETLTAMILKMKSGRSFKQSLSDVIAESDGQMRAKLSEIASAVVFSQQGSTRISDQFVSELITEFIQMERNAHSSMRRLVTLRDRLKLEDGFRRKSGQVLSRVRAQSLLMSGLFVAILFYMINRFGWRDNSHIMIAAIILFNLGSLWIWIGGRRLKWKV